MPGGRRGLRRGRRPHRHLTPAARRERRTIPAATPSGTWTAWRSTPDPAYDSAKRSLVQH